MRQHPGEEGVSEVVGVMLLVGVTVLAVAIVAVALLSGSPPDEIPHTVIIAGINETGSLVLAHEGGDPLREGEYRIYVENESGFVDGTGDFTEPAGGVWSIGGTLAYNGAGTPERVVVTAVSGGSETILAEPVFRGGGAGFSPDPVEPGTVSDGGGNGSEETPISIVIPGIGTTMKFVKIGGAYWSFVSANVTNVSVTRVDFILYGYATDSSEHYNDHQKNVTWVSENGTFETKLGNIPPGQINTGDVVVVVAIAFDVDDNVIGCDARKVSILI